MAGGPPNSRHLGLDLGGTNIKWVVTENSGAGWRRLDRGRVRTSASRGTQAVLGTLKSVGADALAGWAGVTTIGVGVPGLYDPATGTTRFLVNLPGDWAGLPLASEISGELGLPVRLINDARAFGLAELRLGAGRGVDSMIGLTLGTGIGGVIAIDGQVRQGHDGTAGELGHQTIEPDGPWCGCGNRGCLEAFVRGDQIAAICGTASAGEAINRARAGDESARAGLAEIGRYLGIGIGNMISVFTPDRVVIGGGIAAGLDLFRDAIERELQRRVHTTSLDTVEIRAAQLGTWAGAIGASIHAAEAASSRQ